MNTAEIVIREVQGDSGFQVRQLLAERIGQPRKSAHCHVHIQVLPFYETGRDVLGVGIASSDLGYNLRDSLWGLPPFGTVVLARVSEQVHELSKVGVQAKGFRNAVGVVMKPVSRNLHTSRNAFVQVSQEHFRFFTMPLPDVKRGNQLRLCINRYEHPLVSEFTRVIPSHVACLLGYEGPDFVKLQMLGSQVEKNSRRQLGLS
jgi:hypothetical protein